MNLTGAMGMRKATFKRKWSRLPAAEKRLCQMPGCSFTANERCKQNNCGEFICSDHKGSHSALHTFLKQQRPTVNV